MALDCYKILQLENTATLADIKKAYRKLALQFHSDKQPTNATPEQLEKANASFQQLGMAYAVLSDPKRKERYDKTGVTEESLFEDGDKDWTAYFKELWSGIVNEETIEAHKSKYQGSEEERQDVLKAYNQVKGDMDKILTMIECSSASDCPRFEKMIREAIKKKEVVLHKKLNPTTTEKAQQARLKKEAREQAEFDAQQNEKEEDGLAALIQQRNKDRQARMDSIIDTLANSEKKKGKKRKQEDMPSEEEFQQLQEKLFKKKK
ncbi:hypothetical protein CU098_005681 [Rhizopus stolonifer]|uniref:J domain-containing protein n=1 Tax=Rhizopus stolonifer TaxID=4846 RepID=A0A367KJJ7_RHIST|nr:hypothetical protein CU098_005681 [Rhizopus stolonifer]